MTQIIVTRGLPGSGKSTWAERVVQEEDWPHVIVERDQLRYLITRKYWTGDQEVEEKVTRLQEGLVRRYLKEDLSVIISDTHLPDRSVKKWLKIGHEFNVPVEVKDFRHIPLELVLDNNAARNHWSGKYVDPAVIKDKYNRFIKGRDLTKVVTYTPSTKAEIEPYVQPVEADLPPFTPEAVIFDIDGTLAVMGDRSPYDGEKVWMDTPHPDVVKALEFYDLAGTDIIIVSGRDEVYREVTEKWLSDNGIWYHALYMRPTEEGNKREDSIIKYELFNQHIRPKGYRILGVYDDRHRVLRMWRALGLTTFHVNGPDAGDF
jgi:predicted kinase